MALTLVRDVFQYSQARLGARLVLLAVADQAAEGTATTQLTVTEIGAITRLSRRQVFTSVRELERLGEMSVQRGEGRYAPNRQIITLDPATAVAPASDAQDAERRARRRTLRSRFRRIWDRDGWECQERRPGCTGHRCLTIGHKIPIEDGGSDDDDNVQTECLHCNTAKGAR